MEKSCIKRLQFWTIFSRLKIKSPREVQLSTFIICLILSFNAFFQKLQNLTVSRVKSGWKLKTYWKLPNVRKKITQGDQTLYKATFQIFSGICKVPTRHFYLFSVFMFISKYLYCISIISWYIQVIFFLAKNLCQKFFLISFYRKRVYYSNFIQISV